MSETKIVEKNGEIVVYKNGRQVLTATAKRPEQHKARFNFKSRALVAISLITILTGGVLAVAYLYYDWSITLTSATPQVRFMKWSDSTLSNTVSLPYNVYADAWVKDENSTYGIKNTLSSSKTVSIWFASITGGSYVANVTIQIANETGTVLATIQTTGLDNIGEGYAVSFEADAGGIKVDTMKVYIKGASTVGAVTINLGMKTIE